MFAAGAFVTATGSSGGTSTYGGTSQAAPMAAACATALKQAAPASTVEQRMDAMKLSLTSIGDSASGRSYPFLDCRDAVRLVDPSRFEPIPRNGSQPLIAPRLPLTASAPGAADPTASSSGTEPGRDGSQRQVRAQQRQH